MSPPVVIAPLMFWLAIVGLLFNLLQVCVLSGDEDWDEDEYADESESESISLEDKMEYNLVVTNKLVSKERH